MATADRPNEHVIVFDSGFDKVPWSYRVPQEKVLPTLEALATLNKHVIEVRPIEGDTP